VVQRPDVQDMIRRVRYYVDPEFNKLELQGASLQAMLVEQSMLKIYMKDGKVFSGRTEPAKGSPENPMTYEEVADKFRGNAEFAKWPSQKAATVIEIVKSLESAPDMTLANRRTRGLNPRNRIQRNRARAGLALPEPIAGYRVGSRERRADFPGRTTNETMAYYSARRCLKRGLLHDCLDLPSAGRC